MSITLACNLFGYNRQVYYRSKTRMSQHQSRAAQVIKLVEDLRRIMPRLGGRKLYYKLKDKLQNLGVGRDKLFAILRANHLLIKPKRSYHVTTNSYHRFKKHKNLIEELEVTRPEQVWVSDITYIGTRKHPQYLALVTDKYSKKIMGYDVCNSLSVSGSVRALQMGIKARRYKQETLIHHSDRGLQYCSNEYQKLLQDKGIKCSMTEKYDPYQNAVAERINGILKQEFILGYTVSDIELMQQLVKQSIEIYNQERPHLSCEMKTPNEMHQQRSIKIKTYKTKREQDKCPALQ